MSPFEATKLIVVSNREPYRKSRTKPVKTVGGLVSALDPILRRTGGIWIASGEARECEAPYESSKAPSLPGDDGYTLIRVPLSDADIDDYYNGYANSFLWPMCHVTLDRIYLKRSFWTAYKRVNELFADAVSDVAEKGSYVWLQDYHLSICAKRIRAKRPDIKTSLFWHIPWPSYHVFRICPNRRELLEGMLANDLLGFQLDSFKANFISCVEKELGAKVKNDVARYKGHSTKLRAFPISVDYEWFDKSSTEPIADKFVKGFVKQKGLKGLSLGLGLGRLDYTKGITKCLYALDLFFDKYPQYRGRFTFIQVAVPTRKVEPFITYRDFVKKMVRRINNKFSTSRWRPIVYTERRIPHEKLAGLYRLCDIAVISSLYDGMNLVAKEYVASQSASNGVLLLSEFAGAAENIPGAKLINPYDYESVADALKEALEMSPALKKRSIDKARRYLKRHDVYKWVDDVLTEFRRVS